MQTYQNSWVDGGVTNFQRPLLYKLHNADISEFMGGIVHYTLLVSSNFTNCTMQTCQNSWVEAGVTNV